MVDSNRLRRQLVGASLLAWGLLGLSAPAAAETFVNRWTQVQIGVQGRTAVAQKGAPDAVWEIHEGADGYVRLKSTSAQRYLNIESGLAVSDIQPGWWSAQWKLEPVGNDFYRIKSRWKDVYLNVEQGSLAVTAAQPGWWSAQWQIAGPAAPSTGSVAPLSRTARWGASQSQSPPAEVVQPDPPARQGKPLPQGAGSAPTQIEQATQVCLDRLLKPAEGRQIAWSPAGHAQWGQSNAEDLCTGTPRAEWPIDCFKAALALRAPWQQAISWCRYQGSGCLYSTFKRNGGQWRDALEQCHVGTEDRPGDDRELLGGSMKCTALAAGIKIDEKPLRSDLIGQLCDKRDAVVFPAKCVEVTSKEITAVVPLPPTTAQMGWNEAEALLAARTDRVMQLSVSLCQYNLNPNPAKICLDQGLRSGATVEQVVDVCSLRADRLGPVTQDDWSYGQGMRDSCVVRHLGLEKGRSDFAGAWQECRGQDLN